MKTIEDIENIRRNKRAELDLRVNSNAPGVERHILVCNGTGCTSSKSPEILERFKKIIEEKKIENVRVIKTGCFGLCSKGPIVIIRPDDTFYSMVTPDDCEEIIDSHIS
jgi:NADP-reducing hydrogenase subunit HndC